MTGFRWGNKLDWDCKARGMCYHAALYRADAMGLLRRPLGGSGGRAPYLNVTNQTGDAGGQPTTERE